MVSLATLREELQAVLEPVLKPYDVDVTGPNPVYADGADRGSFRSFCFVTLLDLETASGSGYAQGPINANAIYGISIGFDVLETLEEMLAAVMGAMVGLKLPSAVRMVQGPTARFIGVDKSRKVWSYSILAPVPIIFPPAAPPQGPPAVVEVWQEVRPNARLDPATTDPILSPGGDERVLVLEANTEPNTDGN